MLAWKELVGRFVVLHVLVIDLRQLCCCSACGGVEYHGIFGEAVCATRSGSFQGRNYRLPTGGIYNLSVGRDYPHRQGEKSRQMRKHRTYYLPVKRDTEVVASRSILYIFLSYKRGEVNRTCPRTVGTAPHSHKDC